MENNASIIDMDSFIGINWHKFIHWEHNASMDINYPPIDLFHPRYQFAHDPYCIFYEWPLYQFYFQLTWIRVLLYDALFSIAFITLYLPDIADVYEKKQNNPAGANVVWSISNFPQVCVIFLVGNTLSNSLNQLCNTCQDMNTTLIVNPMILTRTSHYKWITWQYASSFQINWLISSCHCLT